MSTHTYPLDPFELQAMSSWPRSWHQFDAQQVLALKAAEAAGRPLLVRGDPGTGKSQLAHAAAVASGRLFLPLVVDSRTEATDVMWRYDAVARLADAHLAGVATSGITPEALRPEHYIQPGPLWWAFDWQGALAQLQGARVASAVPDRPEGWQPDKGVVLLIDEIDKAEAELPNGLLEALGNGRFSVPLAGTVVEQPDGAPPPLVIITTNDERELPAAFLRRCLVLTLKLPTDTVALVELLVARGKLHQPELDAQHKHLLSNAAQLLVNDRAQAALRGAYAPGVAEYLDLLRALKGMGGDPVQHLDEISAFTFKKQTSM